MPKKARENDPKEVVTPEFQTALKKVLATSKEESDRQLAEFQASNKAKREEKKKKG